MGTTEDQPADLALLCRRLSALEAAMDAHVVEHRDLTRSFNNLHLRLDDIFEEIVRRLRTVTKDVR